MKTILKYSYIFLCAAMLLSSCTETLKESISDVILTKDHHGMNGGNGTNSWEDLKSIPAEGRDISVKVIAEPSTSWTIQGLPNWLTATPSSGTGDAEVVFHADKNTDVDVARSVVLDLVSTIANWPVKKSYMATQMGSAKRINVYPDNDASYIFGANGGYRDIQISSNTSWKIKSLLEFCTLDKNEGTGDGVVRLTVSPYNTLDVSPRFAYIEVTDGNNATVKTITVTQTPISTTVSTQNRDVELPYSGGSMQLSDLGRVEGDYTVSTSASWLSVSQASNSGEIDVTISASANNSGSTREAYVYVHLKEETSKALYVIKVTQTSSFLTVGSTSENFSADGGTKTVSVSSSGDWEASKDAGWLSLTKTGSGIDISASSNESLSTRNATVTVTNGTQTKTIGIKQDARTLTASDQTYSFDANGGTKTYSFTTDAKWTMSESYSWISLSKTSGTGSGSVTITVDPTSSASSRTGYVYFECLGKKYTITITQSATATFSVSTPFLSFDAESGSRTLSITTNGSWSMKSKSSWVTLSKTSGTGNATVTVTATANTGTTSRTGSIVFTGPDGKDYTVSLSQESSYINVTTPTTFNSTPQTQNLTVTTDGNWTATSSVSWLTVSPSSGSGNATLKLSVSDNPSANSRTGYVTVKKTSNSAAKTIAVVQCGRSLSVSAESLTMNAGGETQMVTVTTDASSSDIVATSSSTSWLTVTRNGNVLSIKATANSTASERKGIVTVSLNGVSGVSKTINVTQKEQTLENGHEYVDLGLSVKWATMNVGASKPEDYGSYFAWGETTTKTTYNWSTYKWCNGSSTSMTKYCTSSSYGTVDNKTTLELSDDAARANWGGSWRMPTKAEQDELRTKCTWTWTTQNGVYGRKVVGPNGNSIFLPAAGYRSLSSRYDAGSYGGYWLSSLNTNYSYDAYYLRFGSSFVDWGSFNRYNGRSVRAVCPISHSGSSSDISRDDYPNDKQLD